MFTTLASLHIGSVHNLGFEFLSCHPPVSAVRPKSKLVFRTWVCKLSVGLIDPNPRREQSQRKRNPLFENINTTHLCRHVITPDFGARQRGQQSMKATHFEQHTTCMHARHDESVSLETLAELLIIP
jgi:hypothetical protein